MNKTTNLNAVVASAYTCLLGEGPVWDTENQRLLWVDILNGNIHQFYPETGVNSVFHTGKFVGSIVLRQNGGIIAALQDGFTEINLHNGAINKLSTPACHPEGNRFNDGKCDKTGRYWAGTMSLTDVEGAGKLYTLDTDQAVAVKVENVSISNGLAWSHDDKLFYYIDTPTHRVVAYDYNAGTGSIENKRTVITIPEGFGYPDGMTIDTEGMLWIAFWDGWKVARWNPFNGTLLLQVDLPVARPTCCTFGGKNMDDLYITTASTGLSQKELAEQPFAGALFVIENSGFYGTPPYKYKG